MSNLLEGSTLVFTAFLKFEAVRSNLSLLNQSSFLDWPLVSLSLLDISACEIVKLSTDTSVKLLK